ncbi:MAG: polyphosphate kinase 1 [Flavobacteriales bacterium]
MDLINRELSWLSFNERVLQEAEDKNNPIIERLRFLGIFSNNLDEFFRVRVASVKRVIEISTSSKEIELHKQVLLSIKKKTLELQKRFDETFGDIIKGLDKEGVHIRDERSVSDAQKKYIKKLYKDEIRHNVTPIMIKSAKDFPKLDDNSMYLFVRLVKADSEKEMASIIQIPKDINRFYKIPAEKKGEDDIILIDDIIRLNLNYVFRAFELQTKGCYAFKITRDAELDLDNDVSESMLEKMKKGLRKRKSGLPVRFVYDKKMPDHNLGNLIKALNIKPGEHIIPGGRYHNFKDFIGFPKLERTDLNFDKLPQVKHKDLRGQKSLINVIKQKDVLLHYPYHSFDYFIDLLQEAAIDPKVKKIKILIYRLASNSKVIKSLVNAVRNGKDVTVVIELKARFDEDNNIGWTKYLRERGVRVFHGFEGLKIHSKLCVITRKEGKNNVDIASVGTGNFNEKTAKIYGDIMLLTADKRVTKEVNDIFDIVEGKFTSTYHKHIVLSPKHFRNKLVRLINFEAKQAKAGHKAEIKIKLNSLVDSALIRKLYQASQAGVKIQIIVRGICRLKPQVKGLSENIEVISILDRYLEHTRIYYFHHAGDDMYYISSADWMVRNLDRRIELTCPIYDKSIRSEINDFWNIQWQDNIKSRVIDAKQKNLYKKSNSKQDIRAQYAMHDYYKHKLNNE